MKAHIQPLESLLGYQFLEKEILKRALTHSSYAHERGFGESYESLEFLGDSVLDFVLSTILYEKFPELDEGGLSRIRSSLVNEKNLSQLAQELGLDRYIFLGRGQRESTNGIHNSILADVLESIVGAIYLDGGVHRVWSFIVRTFKGQLEAIGRGTHSFTDYKTELQERVQGNSLPPPTYRVIKEIGPDHEKTFYVEVLVDNRPCGHGEGPSKKEAEQNAAKEALKLSESL